MSGSGKSTLAWNMYLAKFPRRLLLDQTGEWSDPGRYPRGYPGPDVVVYSVEELSWALHKYAPVGRWTIACEIDFDAMPQLVSYLIPVPQLHLSPIYRMHGAVLLVDEVDLVAPPRSLKEEVRTLYRRSRHVGLSVVSTTQRPEAVSREVSAQSSQVVTLALVEPDAVDYMERLTSKQLTRGLPAWVQRHPHGGVWWDRQTGRALWLAESGALVPPAQASVPLSDDDDDEPESAAPPRRAPPRTSRAAPPPAPPE